MSFQEGTDITQSLTITNDTDYNAYPSSATLKNIPTIVNNIVSSLKKQSTGTSKFLTVDTPQTITANHTFSGGLTVSGGLSGISKTTVGLDNVDNTSDLDKPISTATQTALNGKQATLNSSSTITVGSLNGITSTKLGYLSTITSDVQNQINSKQATISSSTDLTTGNITIPTGRTINATAGSIIAPTKPQGDNSNNVATTFYTDLAVSQAVSNLINGSPLALNTLSELATALNNDASYATTITNNLATKGGLTTSNTWSNTNNFTGTVNLSSLPVYGSTTLIDKTYTDTQLGTKGNLTTTNTWTKTNTFTSGLVCNNDMQCQDLVIGDGGNKSIYWTTSGSQVGQIEATTLGDINIIPNEGRNVNFKSGSVTNYTISNSNVPTAPTDLVSLSMLNNKLKENKYSKFNYGKSITSISGGMTIPTSMTTFLNFTDTSKLVQVADVLITYNIVVSNSGSQNYKSTYGFVSMFSLINSGSVGKLKATQLNMSYTGYTTSPTSSQTITINSLSQTYVPLIINYINPTKLSIVFGFPSYTNSTNASTAIGGWITAISASCEIISAQPNLASTNKYYSPSALLSDLSNNDHIDNSDVGGAYLSDT